MSRYLGSADFTFFARHDAWEIGDLRLKTHSDDQHVWGYIFDKIVERIFGYILSEVTFKADYQRMKTYRY